MESYQYRTSATQNEVIVYQGQAITFRRAFNKSVIRIENVCSETARINLKWSDNSGCLGNESASVFCLTAGSTLEFDPPEMDHSPQFLDVIVVEHLEGSMLSLSCEVPIESLN
jgi:hypothetical protein